MDNIKISIIIPVFNGENTITRCLDSVLLQTVKSYEIICIDDGSTDRTVEIIKQYVDNHREVNIYLIRQCNSGSGSARNKGIEAARGEYIAFIDADDCFIDNDALEKMYKLCEEKQVKICGSRAVFIDDKGIKKVDFYNDNEPPFNKVVNYSDYQMDYGYCFFIYNRVFLLDYNIRFPDYRRYQDPVFFVRAMDSAQFFVMADAVLYGIYTSINYSKFNPNKVIDLLKALIENMEFAMEKGYDLLFKRTSKRLNYEYKYIILNSLFEEHSGFNSEIFGLLVLANEMERKYLNKKVHTMHIFDDMGQRVAYTAKNYSKYLLERISDEDKIAVYGAGAYGKVFLDFLSQTGLNDKVVCFFQSYAEEDKYLDGIPILPILKYQEVKCKIYVAVSELYQSDIVAKLKQCDICNYELLDGMFLCSCFS